MGHWQSALGERLNAPASSGSLNEAGQSRQAKIAEFHIFSPYENLEMMPHSVLKEPSDESKLPTVTRPVRAVTNA
jgi:hypothetical protein